MNRRETKGHGVLGFFLTFIFLIVIFVVVYFMLTKDVTTGLKGEIYKIFYPQKYSEQVEKYSAEFDVDEALVYAVMRTESGFRAEVESHAGAVGLMQLLPSTFEWLQESLDGEVTYSSDSLTDPDVNVRYGTYLLSILLNRYNGDIKTVMAAYNAGTTTVDGWLSDTKYSSNGTTLTAIPYSETESYAEKVEQAYDMYKSLYYQTQ